MLMDTSHPWMEERFGPEIALIDDVTSRLSTRFFPRDTGAANRQMIVDYLRAHGRTGALYTDRAGHFKANWRAKGITRWRTQTAPRQGIPALLGGVLHRRAP
jgi:hypothetical protein